MGRHSSPEQGPFYRSIIAWALPWLVMAAFVIVAVYIAVDVVGNDDEEIPTAAPSASPEPRTEPTDEPLDTPEPEESEPEPERTPKADEPKALITEDITVQVLNGTAAPEADDRMADRLTGLGYEVISVQGASKEYPRTTVFWSFPAAREAAERLAARFEWIAGEKPSNLSTQVDLHVVVGNDEA